MLEGSAVFLGPDAGGGAVLPNGGATKESFLDVGGGSGLAFAAVSGVTFAVWAKVESYQNSHGMILFLRDRSGSKSIQLYHLQGQLLLQHLTQ